MNPCEDCNRNCEIPCWKVEHGLLAEVVHSKWNIVNDLWDEDTVYQCHVCKASFVLIEGTPYENLWNYCPNCGAKMDLEE